MKSFIVPIDFKLMAKRSKQKKGAKYGRSLAEEVSRVDMERDASDKKEEVKNAEGETMALIQSALSSSSHKMVEEHGYERAEMMAHYNSVRKVLRSSLSQQEKERLVTFLALSAAKPKLAESYGKVLRSSTLECSLWDADVDTVLVAGSLGCLLLSTANNSIPPGLIELKKMWVKANGGYHDCFSAERVAGGSLVGEVVPAMKVAWAVFRPEDAKLLISTVSSNVRALSYSGVIDRGAFIHSAFNWISEGVDRYTPALIKAKVTSFITVVSVYGFTIAIAFVCLICVYTAIFCRSKNGFLFDLLGVFISVADSVLIYLLGSRVSYVIVAVALILMIILCNLCTYPEDPDFMEYREEKRREVANLLAALDKEESEDPEALAELVLTEGPSRAVKEDESTIEDAEDASEQAFIPKKNHFRRRNVDRKISTSRRQGGDAQSDRARSTSWSVPGGY